MTTGVMNKIILKPIIESVNPGIQLRNKTGIIHRQNSTTAIESCN
jgi:hypothetical protein